MFTGRNHAHERRRLATLRRVEARVQLEQLEPRELLATFVVTDTSDDSRGSLREAMLLSNQTPGPNVIEFRIQGTAPFVIQPTSALPTVTQPVLIDGTSQPGYQGMPLVEVDGTNAGGGLTGATVDGFDVAAGNTQVRGLAIQNFTGSGVVIDTQTQASSAGPVSVTGNVIGGNGLDGVFINASAASDNLVAGNWIGFDLSGTALGNKGNGILLAGGDGNTIGGTTAAASNVISSNGLNGIALQTAADLAQPITNTVVAGNFIGTNLSGSAPLGNGGAGILVAGVSTGNTLGGVAAGSGNVIGGNGTGIAVVGPSATANQILGNFIGTGTTGQTNLANQQNGILLANASGNTVGGTVTGAGNTIANNAQSGVQVNAGTGDAILANSIFSNVGGGISLLNNGNRNQPAPVLTEAFVEASSTTITGTLQAAPAQTFRVELFSDPGDPSGFGQGKTYLGSTSVTTNASGFAAFSTTVPVVVKPGLVITGTATDPAGNTSAFSRDLTPGVSFTVTNTNDSGAGSLRMAILNANRIPGRNLIDFAIPGTGPFVIAPSTPLPAITEAVDLDASTQPGFAGSPIVDLSGARLTTGAADGLVVRAPNTRIRGLAIGQFPGVGIHLIGGGGSVIEGDYLGTDVTGTMRAGNENAGIAIDDSPNNTVGGTVTGARDVISGNGNIGIMISGPASHGNSVQGNYIGTDVTGALDLGNTGAGVFITDAPNNTIGGLGAGTGNVVAGTSVSDIQIVGAGSTGNLVLNNKIGTNPPGTSVVGRAQAGVFIQGASGNRIGSSSPNGANVIAGSQVGIELYASGTSGNVILANRIGTNAAATSAIGNDVGVFLYDAPGNQVGGSGAGDGNVISGNTSVGIRIYGSSAQGNAVQGNLIGTDGSGTVALGNGDDGILISGPGNLIGGSIAGARNVVSGNGYVGIQLLGSAASGNTIQGNLVGTNLTGTKPIPNGVDGIYVNGAPKNLIGGTATGTGNLVSGNVSSAIQLFGAATSGNVVQGNRIGYNADGTAPIGNGYGVFLNTLASNTIGGSAPGEANDLRGNLYSNVFAIAASQAPTIQSLQLLTSGSSATALVVTFGADMDPSRAQQLRNYRVQRLAGQGQPRAAIRVTSAVYDAIQRTVTLSLSQPLPLSATYGLTVNGMAPRGLASPRGILLDGSGNGRPGTNYVVRFGAGTPISSANATATLAVPGVPPRPNRVPVVATPLGPRRHRPNRRTP